MAINPGQILRATVNYTAPNASIMQNVFYWSVGGQAISWAAAMTALELFFTDSWLNRWAAVASLSAKCTNFTVDIVTAEGYVVGNVGGETFDVDGITAGEVSSAAVSAYLLAQTAIPKARGSKYIPGISEARITNGMLDAPAITQLSLMLLAYLATINVPGGGTLIPGVASRVRLAFIPFIAEGLVNDIPAYQRRRKPQVGI